tara:strand:- start:548 stop:766 length:219 start_codon:yes stop_codon:yes gene_type:complete
MNPANSEKLSHMTAICFTFCYVALIIVSEQKRIDATKITTIEEIKLILDGLDIHMNTSAPNYEKLKHLVKED